MQLEYLNVEETIGEQFIVDGCLVKIILPFGLIEPQDFRFYLPERDTYDLSEEFLNWVVDWGKYPIELSAYGLYSIKDESGFRT